MYYRNGAKYNAVKTTVEGRVFDSKLEGNFYRWLSEEKSIKIIARQKEFILQEKFRYQGKAIREIKYIADFIIMHKNQLYILETKGFETPDFKIKEKMLFKHLVDTKSEYTYIKVKSWKDFCEKIKI